MQTQRVVRRDFRVLGGGLVVEVPPPRITATGLIRAARWPLAVLAAGILLWGGARLAIHTVDWLTVGTVSQVRSYHLQLAETARAGERG